MCFSLWGGVRLLTVASERHAICPAMSAKGEKKHIVQRDICSMVVMHKLKISSTQMQDNVARVSSVFLLTGKDNSDFIDSRCIVAMKVGGRISKDANHKVSRRRRV